MKILDTNLWVFGTLGTNDRAERLLDDIERGETVSAINAYMVQEALNAFGRTPGLRARERDELKTLFLTRLTRMTGLIEAPSSRDFADSVLENDERTFTPNSSPELPAFSRKISRSSFWHSSIEIGNRRS